MALLSEKEAEVLRDYVKKHPKAFSPKNAESAKDTALRLIDLFQYRTPKEKNKDTEG